MTVYRLEVSPGGRKRYIPEKEYHRPTDGIMVVKTTTGCHTSSVVVPGGVEIQHLAELVSKDSLAAAVVQLYDVLADAIMRTNSSSQSASPADKAKLVIESVLGSLSIAKL